MGTTRARRADRLAEALARRGVLHLREAAELLAVSEMTVRRDVAAASERFAYLGGHIVSAADFGGTGYVLAREADRHARAKREACAHAVRLLRPDDTVFVDCGTTLVHLAAHVPAAMPLTVVCHSLDVAAPFRAMANVRLVLLGGLYQPVSDTFSGEEGLEALGRIGLDVALISAGGIHAERGASCSHFHEVPYKRRAMAGAARRLLVADTSKLGRVRAAVFAAVGAFDGIVTERGVDGSDAAGAAAGLALDEPTARALPL